MIANEMANRLEILIDRTSSRGAPGYEDTELSILLTKSMWQFIKQTISPLTNAKRQGIEESEIRNQGFSNLIATGSETPVSNTSENLENGQFVDLPSDFMYTLQESVVTNKLKCNSESDYVTCVVDAMSHNDFQKLRNNPYRKPFIKNDEGLVWRMQVERETSGTLPNVGNTAPDRTAKRHEIITDGSFTATTYKFRYLKFPPDIVVDFDTPANQRNCVLDDSTHEAILEIAAGILRTSTDRQTVPNVPPIQNFE